MGAGARGRKEGAGVRGAARAGEVEEGDVPQAVDEGGVCGRERGRGEGAGDVLCWVCLPHLRTSSGHERGAARGVVAGAAWDHAPAVRAWASAWW